MHEPTYCFFISGSWSKNANRERLESLANALVDLGHQVVIIVDHKKTKLINKSSNPSIFTWPSYRPTKLKDAIFLWKLVRLYKPDCMISQFGSENVMLLIGWLLGVPNRLTRYETISRFNQANSNLTNLQSFWFRFRKCLLLRLVTIHLANSQSAGKDLMEVYKIRPEKIKVFYNYLSDPLLKIESSTQFASKRIICVGRILKPKGQDVLIRALALVPHDLQLEVEFVGDGTFLKEVQELAESLGVKDQCVFSGVLGHDQVFNRFAQAAVSVVPSLDEAFGFVCIESLAVGTPVIGSNVGGIKEIIRDTKDGFLFEPGNPQALADKIKLFFGPETDQSSMRVNARQRFISNFEQKILLRDQTNWLLSELKKKRKGL